MHVFAPWTMFQQTGAEILFTFYPILGLSGSPDSSTNSLREICLPNQKLVKKCRDAQRAEENNNNKKKKLQKKKRDQKNTGKKKGEEEAEGEGEF